MICIIGAMEMIYLSSRSFAQSCFGDLDKVIGSDMDPKFLIDDLIAKDIEIPRIFMAVGDNDFLYNENMDYYNYLKSRNVDVEFRCSPRRTHLGVLQ